MVAKQQFFSKDFLDAMPDNELVHPHWLSQQLGCINKTTIKNLVQLEEVGKVQRVQALGSREILWQKVV